VKLNLREVSTAAEPVVAKAGFTPPVYSPAQKNWGYQLERLLLFTYPVFVVIIGALFMGVKISGQGVLCIAVAYAGIALIFAGGDIAAGEQMWRGVVLVLACALLFAIFQILAKPMIDRMGGRLFTCLAMIAASTTVMIHFFISYGVLQSGGRTMGQALDLSPQILGLGFILGIFCTVIPSFLMNLANGRIGAQAVSTLGMVSPIFTIVAAILLLGEPFGIVDGIGTALTLVDGAVSRKGGPALLSGQRE